MLKNCTPHHLKISIASQSSTQANGMSVGTIFMARLGFVKLESKLHGTRLVHSILKVRIIAA